MYLIQILLPVYDNEGNKFEAEQYTKVRLELTEAFGGSTAYSRAPAEGLWHDAGTVKKDDIVIIEVMARSINKRWWARYRKDLAERFKQEVLVVRAHKLETL
jgi:ABC-type sulfate transport system substrate-binding protein